MREIGEERLRCAHCGDVVGVYEPAVIFADGVAHDASLAGDLEVPFDGAQVYHRACSAHVPSDR